MVKTLALAGMAVLTMGTLAGCGSNTTESTAAPTTAQSEAETTTAGTASAETTTAAPKGFHQYGRFHLHGKICNRAQ